MKTQGRLQKIPLAMGDNELMQIQDICFHTLITLTAIFAFGATGGVALALRYSPKITSQHVPSSLKAYRNFPAWKDKQGQELALAAWKCFVGTETGVFHYQPIREGPDPVDWEFRIIRDPIKMLNVYGYGFCGAFGPTTAGFFEGLGFEKARSVNIPGVNHAVANLTYGRIHLGKLSLFSQKTLIYQSMPKATGKRR